MFVAAKESAFQLCFVGEPLHNVSLARLPSKRCCCYLLLLEVLIGFSVFVLRCVFAWLEVVGSGGRGGGGRRGTGTPQQDTREVLNSFPLLTTRLTQTCVRACVRACVRVCLCV